MRRQSLIAIGIAVFLGLIAVFAANTFLTRTERRADAAAAKAELTKVAVAAVPLDYGVELTPEKIRFVDYPVNSLPAGSFRQMGELLPPGKKRIAFRPMQVNEPILASKLMGEGLGISLASVLADGNRATTVRINDVSGVAGFIEPNDSVDVLVTREVGSSANASQANDVLLQNVRVIAMGQNAKGADGKPALAKSATLEVSPTDAQKLALAQQVGSLSLVLRKPGVEQNIPQVQTVSMNDLRYSYYGGTAYRQPAAIASTPRPTVRRTPAPAPRRTAQRPPAPVAPRRPPTNNVEVVRGTQGSNYEVGGYGS